MESKLEKRDAGDSRIEEVLDCSGLLCPLPVYKTTVALARLRPGQVIRVICTDPGSLEDFPALARQGRHDLLSVEESGDVQTFVLRKGNAR